MRENHGIASRENDNIAPSGNHGTTRAGRVEIDNIIMELAAPQHGVVARSQLLRAGVAADVVDRRLKSKWLRAKHRGVYRVGPVLAPHAQEMAAVLACGGSSVLSHWSASLVWQLPLYRARPDRVEVSAAGGAHPRVPGVRIHRVRTLPPDDVTVLDGIPFTTAARPVCDLASTAAARELERMVAAALSRGITNRAELLSVLMRASRRRGIGRLRVLLESDAEPALTRSDAEDRFLALIRRAQLPKPAVNPSVGGYTVDFFWRAERFVVEIDGFVYHSSAPKFESDRQRDAEFAAAGVRVMRVTWRQLVRESEAVLVRLAQALARPIRE